MLDPAERLRRRKLRDAIERQRQHREDMWGIVMWPLMIVMVVFGPPIIVSWLIAKVASLFVTISLRTEYVVFAVVFGAWLAYGGYAMLRDRNYIDPRR